MAEAQTTKTPHKGQFRDDDDDDGTDDLEFVVASTPCVSTPHCPTIDDPVMKQKRKGSTSLRRKKAKVTLRAIPRQREAPDLPMSLFARDKHRRRDRLLLLLWGGRAVGWLTAVRAKKRQNQAA
ncbi:unnamed protein product [Nippostrongylus brasiliensis]|uniref:Uncharacterized protein n=1 Tax=Nippostrongylus brasiliensis TaxID=27835 RepID=A0A0N4Y076_NIPBR|nr:unnamed protein product [Nippostrongylus brasiliensis]